MELRLKVGFQLVITIILYSSLVVMMNVMSVNGQISTPCTGSMITSFTPCLNYITGSSSNGASPTSSCCNALKSMMSNSMDCTCLVITASVPVQLPINRTLAISLPQACKMGGVPIQCKASGSPLPAPGPVLFGPTLPPPAASPLSPRASKAVVGAVAPAPELDGNIEPPVPAASSPVEEQVPPSTTGIRPVLTPAASISSYASPPPTILLILVALTMLLETLQS